MTAPLPVWLAAARYRAVQERPYLAAALWAVTFVPRPGMGSMAIDRWGRLYYDPAVGTMWSVEEVATILVHEVHHLLRAHHERVGQYPPAVANAAADFEVNDDLAREGARFPTRVIVDGEEIPIQPLLPEAAGLPPNRTAEEYAELLLASPASLPFPPRGGVAGAREDRAADPAGGSAADSESAADSAGSRAGERADAAASAAADTPLAAPADATASAARSGSTAAGGTPAAGGGQLPPDTPASSRGQSGSGDPALPPIPTAGGGGSAVTGRRAPWEDPEPGEPGAAPGLSPAELTILRRQVAAAVVRIAESSASRGSLPAGLVRWAEATLAPPRVPWQAALRAAVRAALRTAPGGEDYSYRRPNRRAAAYEPFVPPALRRPVPEVAAVLDTSGSIADRDLARATAELVALVRALGGEGVYVVACDAAVQAEGLVRREADVRPLLRGGGGTDLRVGLAHLARRRPRPQVVVMFTDCHTPWPEQPPAWTRVIVARIGAAGQAPPWATVVDLELEEES